MGVASFPAGGMSPADLKLEMFDTHGREVGYATGRPSKSQEKLIAWLRENPHRLHLGRIGFTGFSREDVTDVEQTLDLWTGELHSRFRVKDVPFNVLTFCHPDRDALRVMVIGKGSIADRHRVPLWFRRPYSGRLEGAESPPDRRRQRTDCAANSTPIDIGCASPPKTGHRVAPARIVSNCTARII